MKRTCSYRKPGGEPCGATPQRDKDICVFHDPEHQPEAGEARRLGGQRVKREVTLAAAYGLEGLDDLEQARRLLELVTLEALALDNGVARNRLLLGAVVTRLRLIGVSDLDLRLAALEQATSVRSLPSPVFEVDPEETS